MVRHPPREGRALSARTGRGVPLLVIAELPPAVLAWADGLRRAHYPPHRNRLVAHVTLFHALPPSIEGELRRLLAECAREPAPEAAIAGIMDLGTGTAFLVESPAMLDLYERMAERLHGVLAQQDAHRPRLHITVQNKVERPEARRLQAELTAVFTPKRFRFAGFGLHAWEEGLWRPIRSFAFR